MCVCVVVQSSSQICLFATPWLQHATPPCPSPSPKVCPSSCPLHWWCRPAISSSDTLFSFCPQSFPASGTFPVSQLFASDDQNTGVSTWASVLPTSVQGWSPLRLTCLILQPKGLSGVFSSTIVRRHQFFGALTSLWSSSHNCTWPLGRPKPWLYRPFWQSNVSAFQHTLWVCHSFPAKKQAFSDFMAVVTIFSDFRAQEEKICHSLHFRPLYLPWSDGAGCHDLFFFFFCLSKYVFIYLNFILFNFTILYWFFDIAKWIFHRYYI